MIDDRYQWLLQFISRNCGFWPRNPFSFFSAYSNSFFQSSARGSSLLKETWPPSPALLSLLPHLTLLLPLLLGSWMCSSLHRTCGSEPGSSPPPSCLGIFHPSNRSKWWVARTQTWDLGSSQCIFVLFIWLFLVLVMEPRTLHIADAGQDFHCWALISS